MDQKRLAYLKAQLRPIADRLELRGVDVDSFRHLLQKFRGRYVYLLPVPTDPETPSIWAATDFADCVFYDQRASPYRLRHLVLHEGSHMLLGHTCPDLADAACAIAPLIDPRIVRSLFRHTTFDKQEEAEAEVLATLIEEHMDRPSS